MDNKELLEKLVAMENTLNQVEVKGKLNLSMLLGVINMLGNMISKLNTEQQNKKEIG